MDIDVRPAQPHELRAVSNVMRVALLNALVNDEDWEKWRGGWEHGHLAIGAWDGDTCVGHAGAFHFDTMVPGGAWLPTAGVTRVGVLPTHIRRGLLTRMMRRLLEDERADGKVLASLRASEAVIYPRFGFGLAGEAVSVTVHPRRARPVLGAAPGTVRILRPDEIMSVVPALYARMQHRAGAVSRDDFMWGRYLSTAIEASKPEWVVVHTDVNGVDDGFVHYTVEWEHLPMQENLGTCEILDLFGVNPAAELAMWDYITSISLMRTITVQGRPVDDLVRHAIPDARAYAVRHRWDEQWLRLLDVPAALTARRYRPGEPVTIAVSDPWFPENERTFRVAPDGVQVVDGPGELQAPIGSISAAYMGAVAWRDLLLVGRITGDAGAARRADELFAHSPGTWSGTFF